jgi:hypothetical protein
MSGVQFNQRPSGRDVLPMPQHSLGIGNSNDTDFVLSDVRDASDSR